MKVFQPTPQDLVLDLGGGDGRYFASLYPWPERIVILDINFKGLQRLSQSIPVCGNGTELPFKDEVFDIVWSNAVIEHVGGFEVQRRFAAEIRRVGRGYFVTTPWKGFPIELHYKLPFYQFVPKRIQQWISKYVALGWYERREWEDINLLWQHELQKLFPDARVIKQRVTLWPETLIAYRMR